MEFYSSLGNFPAPRVPGLRTPALYGRCPARDGLGPSESPPSFMLMTNCFSCRRCRTFLTASGRGFAGCRGREGEPLSHFACLAPEGRGGQRHSRPFPDLLCFPLLHLELPGRRNEWEERQSRAWSDGKSRRKGPTGIFWGSFLASSRRARKYTEYLCAHRSFPRLGKTAP